MKSKPITNTIFKESKTKEDDLLESLKKKRNQFRNSVIFIYIYIT
jgi:hypothetical protein